jgi:thioredoxin reductase
VVEELEIRRSPLTGEERVRTGAVLERAGLDDDEILALIGEDPTEEEAAEQQDYAMEQLASFDVTRLAELFAAGVISEEEYRTSIEQSAKTGDI